MPFGWLYIAWLLKRYNHKPMPSFHEELGYWVVSSWEIKPSLSKRWRARKKFEADE